MNNLYKKIFYYFFNVIIIACSIFFFGKNISTMNIFNNISVNKYYIIIVILVLLVLIIKYVRVVSILMYADINNERIIKTYLKTVFVLISLPFKLGELYRFFAFGKEMRSYSKGIVTIIIDRFFDLSGLLIVFYIMRTINNSIIVQDTIITVIFMVVIMIFFLFITFEKTAKAYKNYVITHIHSKNILNILKYINNINKLYIYVNNIIKDRGIFLLILSLISWLLEYFAIYITINKIGYNSKYPSHDYASVLFYGNDVPFYVYSSIQFSVLLIILSVVYFYYNILRKVR